MASSITLYGIPNCDTVKKARLWLDANGKPYQFHDFRKDGLSEAEVTKWIKALGWETVLNRKGTTWRKLPEDVRENVSESNIARLLVEQPTLIKRPVLESGSTIHCGFKADDYQSLLK